MVYSDASRPEMRTGFVENTIIAMVEGVKAQALQMGLMESDAWIKGIERSPQYCGAGWEFLLYILQGSGCEVMILGALRYMVWARDALFFDAQLCDSAVILRNHQT